MQRKHDHRMTTRIPIVVAVLACALAGSAGAQTPTTRKVSDDMASARVLVYTSGMLYRPGFKISRPGATTNGKYPPGSFAVVANDGSSRYPGLGTNRLDWGAAVGDYSRAPWQVTFAVPVAGFTATCYDPPNSTVKSPDICWIRLYDYYGTLVAEKSAKRSPTLTTATTVTATAPYAVAFRAEFGADQNSPSGSSPGVDWGNFVTDTGIEN